MYSIDDEIKKALKEEKEEEKKEKTEKPSYLKTNMVTIPLDEYLNMFKAVDEYAQLLSLIFSNIELSEYRENGARLKDDERLLNFVETNHPYEFLEVLNSLRKDI